ncbi:MAG: hypothetical protein QM764_02120 [Chitinophagaceae bacterium]
MENDTDTLKAQINLLEKDIREAFEMRKPFYTKKEMIQRLKLLINELKTLEDRSPDEIIHKKEQE